MMPNVSSQNGSVVSVFDSYAEKQLLAALYGLMFFTGVLGNSSVLLAVVLSRKPRKIINGFLVNLAVADLVTCLSLPIMILAVLSESKENLLVSQHLCSFQGVLLIVCVGCSMDNISAIAIHRALITRNRNGNRLVSLCYRATLATMVAASWLIPFALAILPIVGDFGSYGYSEQLSTCTHNLQSNGPGTYSKIAGAVFVLVQFFLTSLGYAAVLFVVHRYLRKVNAVPQPVVAVVSRSMRLRHTPNPTQPDTTEQPCNVTTARNMLQVPARNHPQQRRMNGALFTGRLPSPAVAGGRQPAPGRPARRRTRDVKLSLFLVVFFFVVCCTPYVVVIPLLGDRFQKFVPFLAMLLVSNSCINPVIYTARHPDFKTVIRCILLCNLSKIPMKSAFLRRMLSFRG
ncbi:G-protein coupled receptor moody-like [Patiria miniata]|uniref:G-protein coupled receptors family 1 profile domain-containing protein n=1 Tax=Patiria miniata TaxID=46514 RepID=A0A914B514_PATMI|nr:G-protein coupled receptor moody-like [Patiria miniata]